MDEKKIKKLYDRIKRGENIKEIEGKRVQVYAYTYIHLQRGRLRQPPMSDL